MDVEMMSVGFVQAAIAKTDHLVPHISTNDKEPSWDGDVEVYRKAGNVHEKKDLILKVPIQVKGHKENNVSKQSIKFSVSMADLRNYLNIGGTTYIVVYINDDEDYQIYYNALLPYDLKKLISKYGDKKSKRIELKALPKNKNEISDIFLFAAMHMQKQRASISCDPMSMEDLIKSGQVTSFSFGYTRSSSNNCNPIEYMFDHETYLYAKLPLGIEIPVQHIKQIDSAKSYINCPVTVNGKQFYDECEISERKESITLRLGKSTEIFIPRNRERQNFTFSLAGTLSERIKDEDFIIQTLESKQFEIGENIYPLIGMKAEELESFAIDERKSHLQWLKTIKRLFDKLGITSELDCDKVSEIDDELLYKIAKSVLNEECIEWNFNDEYFPEITIGNITFKLAVIKVEDHHNHCRLFPYCNSPVGYQVTYNSGVTIDESYYMLLKKESMLNCCNIDYSVVVDDLKRFAITTENSGSLIWLLLEMLDAYDESSGQRNDILDAAIDFSSWLKNTDTITPDVLLTLNCYQAIARKRSLNPDEIQTLHTIIESKPVTKDVYVATYLLLGDTLSAKMHYDAMEEEERLLFDSYPINRFWA